MDQNKTIHHHLRVYYKLIRVVLYPHVILYDEKYHSFVVVIYNIQTYVENDGRDVDSVLILFLLNDLVIQGEDQ